VTGFPGWEKALTRPSRVKIVSNTYPTIPGDYDTYIARALATEGGHLSIGRGGFTLHFDWGARLSGYDCETIKAACIAAGLPVIDSRMVDFNVVARLAIGGPMIAVGEEPSVPPPDQVRGRLVWGYPLSSGIMVMNSFFFVSALCADALVSQTDCGGGRVKAVSRGAGARQRAP
jgi:hypothetical protein